MIKVQLEALNDLLGIKKLSRDRQRIRATDVEEILKVVHDENLMCLSEGESELSGREAFNLITDLLLEKLYVNKSMSDSFFGSFVEVNTSMSFKELEPGYLKKIKLAMANSAKLLFQ